MEATQEPVAATETAVQTETPKTEPAKQQEFASDKFAALARKEKAIVRDRQELSAMKAKIEKELQSIAQQKAEYERFMKLKENAKLNPDEYLKEAGLSYGYLTEQNLKGGIDPATILEKTQETLSNWEKQQKEKAKIAEEESKARAAKEFEEKKTNFIKGIYDYVEKNKETYEITALNDQAGLVWEVMEKAALQGRVMDMKEAADKVEEYLVSQVEKSIAAKKFKDRFSPAIKEDAKDVKPGAPTLTNNMSASTQINNKGLTDQERMRNAELALKKAFGEI